MFKSFGVVAVLLMLAGCGSSPGPLEGSWRSSGAIAPLTFSPGQMEAMGVMESVEYAVEGNDVTVTLTSGMAKGSSIVYTVKSPTVMQSRGQIYRKM